MLDGLSLILDDLMGLAGFFEKDAPGQAMREHNKMVKASIMTVSKEFPLELADCTNLETFLVFQSLRSPVITYSFRSTDTDLPLELFVVAHHAEECFIGLFTLNREYPFTCIFKETLKEKINDWFLKQDVDFEEQKKFSGQFHVVSRDSEKLKTLLWNKPLDELAVFPEMEIEINGKHCLFRTSAMPLSLEEAEHFTALAKKLWKILS